MDIRGCARVGDTPIQSNSRCKQCKNATQPNVQYVNPCNHTHTCSFPVSQDGQIFRRKASCELPMRLIILLSQFSHVQHGQSSTLGMNCPSYRQPPVVSQSQHALETPVSIRHPSECPAVVSANHAFVRRTPRIQLCWSTCARIQASCLTLAI